MSLTRNKQAGNKQIIKSHDLIQTFEMVSLLNVAKIIKITP